MSNQIDKIAVLQESDLALEKKFSKEAFSRLTNEAKELAAKIDGLEIYIRSNSFLSLNNENQFLLVLQLDSMRQYNAILRQRIRLNKDNVED
ncbi:MAG: crAss001_48 related protein [Fusobacteriaceae bacterium]